MVGEMEVRTGANWTTTLAGAELVPFTLTTTGSEPVGIPYGTRMVMELLLQDTIGAVTPAIVTPPVLVPNPCPATEIVAPAGTGLGDTEVITGRAEAATAVSRKKAAIIQ
jgi:hypothetical protein